MKAAEFDYLRPPDLETALRLMSAQAGEAMALAGGQSLMPMMNFRVATPGTLIDLADISALKGIARIGDTVRIGAMTRYVDLMHDPVIGAAIPLFGMALPHIAHDAIRNRGTIGGSMALADPAAEMPALALALEAQIEVASASGQQMIPAQDFFTGYYETTLAEDALIIAVHVPVATDTQRFGFYELAQRHGDYAIAGAALAVTGKSHRIAFFGVADRAMRVAALEAALDAGETLANALPHLAEIDFTEDSKASAATRHRLTKVVLRRAMEGMEGIKP